MQKSDIDKFFADLESLGLRFPVAEIHKQTGFGKGTISDYLNRKKEPSENFIKAFYKAFKDSIKVPRGIHPEVAEGEIIRFHAASLAVLLDEVAALKAAVTDGNETVEKRKLQKAIEDILKLG